MPGRVVELGSQGAATILRLRDARDGLGEYVALSHCWGTPGTVPKTLQATRAQYGVEIPTSVLTKTFRDAIQVTADLGYKYIWIDSLCIVQNNDDDWAAEAAKMGDIYAGAALVLAAASATDGSGGLFHTREGGYETTLGDFDSAEIVVRTMIDHEFCEYLIPEVSSEQPHYSERPGPEVCPLMYRKWCFQERLLSRRIVHFTKSELVWECRTEAFCECGRPNPQGSGESGSDRMSSDKIGFAPGLSGRSTRSGGQTGNVGRLSSVDDDRWVYVQEWRKLVKQYSKARLSYPTDILPAISGVARMFDGKGLGKYLAGIWEVGIEVQLCWRLGRPYEEPEFQRPSTFCAPSWSWASVMSPFLTEREPDIPGFWDRCTARYLRGHCTPLGIDPFGQVKDGALEIVAPGLKATVSTIDNDFSNMAEFAEWQDPQWCYFDTTEDKQAAFGQTVWLLCLCRTGIAEDELGIYLLLREAEDGKFRRIAVVHSLPLGEDFDESFGRATGDGKFARAVEGSDEKLFTIV
ncbi:hypothetical protein LTR53_016199 [Teratosphaeriaceae sp. CCFEE 6253]|nr:hypothetical protein LTR53_016199 [Teratosphaeriaceae sp. CCFEE 6253]